MLMLKIKLNMYSPNKDETAYRLIAAKDSVSELIDLYDVYLSNSVSTTSVVYVNDCHCEFVTGRKNSKGRERKDRSFRITDAFMKNIEARNERRRTRSDTCMTN
mmetsp:Transcript_12684/g.15749  ORF Transcript_12684/g.15749 Transcript_12684/m.15749 type:complete len:104 (-) Transcript_12684:105-416(-)